MTNPQLIVMAAGMGSRYGGLKQIDPVGPNGEIILDYSVFDAIRAGFSKVVFIIRRDIEDAFREKVGSALEKHIEVEYVFQELQNLPDGFSVPEGRTKPWGTGHAVLCARDAINEPFAVINADDFYSAAAFQTMSEYLQSANDANGVYDYSMVGYRLGNTVTEHGHVARGCCAVDHSGHLSEVVERTHIECMDDGIAYSEDEGATWTSIPADTLVSMNFWGFTPSYMNELEARFIEFLQENIEKPKAEYFIPMTVNQLLQEGKAAVKVLPCEAKWLGVTYQADRPTVQNAIRQMVENDDYPSPLWT